MAYEYRQADAWDLANTFSVEKRQRGNELFFKYCPYCSGGGKDKDTFSINLDDGVFKCFRASCGKQGHFVEMARDFNYPLDLGEVKRYRKLPQREIKTKTAAVRFLEKRGISSAVTEKYKITTRKDDDNILVFPFFDENNVLTFVKYRNMNYSGKGNKEWCEKNTKAILFGMEQCTNFERLVITEGQIDSLSLAECGVNNAVSVPTGAMGFTWVVNVWDWIIKFKEVVVFGDFEKGKMTLIDQLQKRLPNKVKAVQLADFLGEKDANDILLKYGKGAIITAIKNAKVPPIESVKELADVEAVDIYSLPKIKTSIYEIDKLMGGLYFGQVVLLTGKRGEGKSTFMSQLVVEALDQDFPTFVYSGELTDYHFKRWIDFQAAGPGNITVSQNEYGDEIYSVSPFVIEQINNWYRGKAYIYDNNYVGEDELEGLIATIEKTIKQYGIKMVCVDNLMTALDVGMEDDLYRAQSKFVKGLKQIAVKYDVVVVLVAHPRKSKERFQNDDVAGSGDITNRVDVVMVYSRNNDENMDCDGLISITKNRLTGNITGNRDIQLFYSKSTKRISSSNSPERVYGWESPEQQEVDGLPF